MMNSRLNTFALSADLNADRTMMPIALHAKKVGVYALAIKHLTSKQPYVDVLKTKINVVAILSALLVAIGLHMLLLTMLQPTAEPIEMPAPSTPMMVSIIKPQVQKAVSLPKPVPKKVKRIMPKKRVKPVVQKRVEKPAQMLEKAQEVPVTPMQVPVQQTSNVTPVIEQELVQNEDVATAVEETAPVQAQEEAVIEPPKFGVAYLHNPAPSYPSLSHRAGEEGQVILKVLVSASGLANTVAVEKSSQFTRLDQAALAAVKQWRFVPAKKGNETMSAYVLVPISFSLSD